MITNRSHLLPLTLLVLLLGTGCPPSTPVEKEPPPPPPAEEAKPAAKEDVTERKDTLRLVPPAELPILIDDGDWASLRQAIGRDLTYLGRVPQNRTYTYGPREVTAAEVRTGLQRLDAFLASNPTPESLAAQVAYDFDVYRSVAIPRGGTMLFTGYYVPVIEGSKRRSKEYTVPIYGPPRDMFSIDLSKFADKYKGVKIKGILRGNELLPYPDRQKIRATRHLRGREIGWAKNKVDLFFVEVQGSGTVRFPNGKEMRIGYAGANGRQYRSIGKYMIDNGQLDRTKVSMQTIKAYLTAHPDEVDKVLDYNESVVFFRKLNGPALGSLGVPVTGGRSLATDYRLFPRAALCFVETTLPGFAEDGSTFVEGKISRFMVNQDTGGAIRGTDRADFFWGQGDEAAARAGAMKQPGQMYFLVPKVK